MFYGLLGAILLLLWFFSIIDVIITPEGECRHLPKLVWLLLVVVLSTVGAVAWLVAGRPRERAAGVGGLRSGGVRPADGDRRGGAAPDDDEAFLASLRERAESQRRAADRRREQQRAEETEGRPDDTGDEGHTPRG